MNICRQRLESAATPRVSGTTFAKAFSLLELLIVLALILVLVSAIYSSSSGSRQTQLRVACQKNLQTLHLALQIYANDSDGQFPVVTNPQTSEAVLTLLIPRYTSSTEPFICPGSKDPHLPEGEPIGEGRVSYACYVGWRASNATEVLLTDRQVNTDPKAAGQPLFSLDGKGPGNNHHRFGGNLLFCDGHVQMVPARSPRDLTPPSGVILVNPRPSTR